MYVYEYTYIFFLRGKTIFFRPGTLQLPVIGLTVRVESHGSGFFLTLPLKSPERESLKEMIMGSLHFFILLIYLFACVHLINYILFICFFMVF